MSGKRASVLDSFSFLDVDKGFMARAILEYPWETTALGSIESWHPNLKSMVQMILDNPIAMYIAWGPEHTHLYNDACLSILGNRHPSSLGKTSQEIFGSDWENVQPTFDAVMTGGSMMVHDFKFEVAPHTSGDSNYYNLAFSPIRIESGKPAGMLLIAKDVTAKKRMELALAQSNERLSFALEAAELATFEYFMKDDSILANELFNSWFGGDGAPILTLEAWLEKLAKPKAALVAAAINDCSKGQEGARFEIDFETPEGTEKARKEMRLKGLKLPALGDRSPRVIAAIEDITAEKLEQRKLIESEKRFRLLADSLPEFVWIADAQGASIYWNKSMLEYTGLSEADVKLRKGISIVHPDDVEANMKLWNNSLLNMKDFLFEHRFKSKEGVYRWHLSRATPQFDDEGNVQRWVGSSTDIQSIKDKEAHKDFFISMASHELNTPLTTVKGYVQILRETYMNGSDDLLNMSLKTIDKQVATLTKLISDLLDLSKIRMGSLGLECTEFDVRKMLTEVVCSMSHSYPDASIELGRVETLKIFADECRISQVVINFITNAVKYSHSPAAIRVSSWIDEGQLIFSVKDDGIGISAEDQKHIFERFYRVEGKSEKTFPGFGIGLNIAAEIVKQHNGKIWLESELGKGSTFYFCLPVSSSFTLGK